jgi:F-type H+-transporting ATPase subunit epsilon
MSEKDGGRPGEGGGGREGRGGGALHLKVVTPGGLVVEADVEAVSLPSLEGEIGILPGHLPLFTGIGKGEVRWRTGAREQAAAVRGGYAQVQPDGVVVMTDAAGDDEDGENAGG